MKQMRIPSTTSTSNPLSLDDFQHRVTPGRSLLGRWRRHLAALCSATALACLLAQNLSGAELSEFDVEQIDRLCQPTFQEDGWRSIPWQTDLWKARQQAAEQGKPIFLWEMDGHPLGCT